MTIDYAKECVNKDAYKFLTSEEDYCHIHDLYYWKDPELIKTLDNWLKNRATVVTGKQLVNLGYKPDGHLNRKFILKDEWYRSEHQHYLYQLHCYLRSDNNHLSWLPKQPFLWLNNESFFLFA
jgi:hypothetical protein